MELDFSFKKRVLMVFFGYCYFILLSMETKENYYVFGKEEIVNFRDIRLATISARWSLKFLLRPYLDSNISQERGKRNRWI